MIEAIDGKMCAQKINRTCFLCDKQDNSGTCPPGEKLLYTVPEVKKDDHCVSRKIGSCLPCHRLIDNVRPQCPEGLSPLPIARAKRSIW